MKNIFNSISNMFKSNSITNTHTHTHTHILKDIDSKYQKKSISNSLLSLNKSIISKVLSTILFSTLLTTTVQAATWVEIGGGGGSGSTVHVGSTPPSNPSEGAGWVDTSDPLIKIKKTYVDGTWLFESYLDLIEKDTLSEVYDSNGQVVKVGSKIYKKVLDSNNNSCYQLHETTNIYTKNGIVIPSTYIISGKPLLPTNLNCTNVTFNASNILIMDKMEHVVDYYQNAPTNLNVFVSENSKTFQKKASGENGRWLATDNSIQMTKGSRSNLANPGNSTIINLTRIKGTESSYTTNGITYSTNTNFKQWFYSTSGTITNNMLDARLVNAKFGDQNFDDLAQSTWGFDLNTLYVDSTGNIKTITQLGYKKYCQESYADFNYTWYYGKKSRICWKNSSHAISYINGWFVEGTSYFYNYSGRNSSSNCNQTLYTYRIVTTNNQTSSCGTTGTDVWYKP